MADNSDEMDAILNAGDKVEKALDQEKKTEAESERLQRRLDEQDAQRDDYEREQEQQYRPDSSPEGDNADEMDAVLREGDKVEKALDGGAKAQLADPPAKPIGSGRGCVVTAAALVGLIAIGLGVFGLGRLNDHNDSSDEPPAAAAASVNASTADPTPTEATAETPDAATSQSPPEITSGVSGPPAASEVPPGAILVSGRSGGPIGCIPCDGKFRFMSLKSPGVVVGTPETVNTEWTQDGQVLEFGAKLSGANQGRYGVNLYIDGKQFGPGAALEKGQSSSLYKYAPGTAGAVLHKGDQLSIIVGEGGNLEERGDSSLEWWFVFQPAA